MRALNLYYKYKPFLIHNIWAGLTTVAKALNQIFLLKITTLLLGPAALALLGQALSCILIFQNLSSGGVLNYVITSLSSDKNKDEVIGNVTSWSLVVWFIFLIVSIFWSKDFSRYVFSEESYYWYFIILSMVTFIFSLNMVTTGVFSANKNVKFLFYSHATTLFIGCFVFYYLLRRYQLNGAILGTVIVYAIQSLSFLFYAKLLNLIRLNHFRPRYSKDLIRTLGGFAVVTIVTGVLGSLYQIFMRSYLASSTGMTWEVVGEWQAVIKVSEITMSFLGISLMTSYFPSLSRATSIQQIKTIIWDHGVKFLVLILLSCGLIAAAAPLVLELVYSKELLGATQLLRLQMAGDIFKFLTSLAAYFFLAKLSIVVMLAYEVITLLLLLVLSVVLSTKMGILGMGYANLINGFIACVIGYMLIYFFCGRWSKYIKY